MPTQQIEFTAASGQTITATLHQEGNDAIAYTASAVVEQTNRKGVYRATFSGIAAGFYQLIGRVGASGVASFWGYAADFNRTYQFNVNAAAAYNVWEEDYSIHTTAGTFGKLMDIMRKANLATDGTVTATQTPTTLSFTTNLTQTSGAHDSKLLLFTTGSLTGQSKPIDTYSVTNGRITLQEALTAAPATSDQFVVIPQHIHSMLDSAVTIRSVGVGIRAAQADDGTIVLYDGRTYNGTAHPKLSFTVTKNYSAAAALTLRFYSKDSASTIYATSVASAVSSTLIEVPSFIATFSPVPVFSGTPAVFECSYALTARWGASDLETIATGHAFLFAQPS